MSSGSSRFSYMGDVDTAIKLLKGDENFDSYNNSIQAIHPPTHYIYIYEAADPVLGIY